MTTATESILSVSLFISEAAERGADAAALWRVAGVDPADTTDPLRRVDSERLYDVIEEAVRTTGLTDLCVRMQEVRDLAAFGAYGFAFASSSDLQDAIRRMSRLGAFWTTDVEVEWVPLPSGARIVLHSPSPPRPGLDWRLAGTLGGIVVQGRRVTRAEIIVHDVYLPGPPLSDRACYERVFGREITFNAPKASLELEEGDLRLPLGGADATAAAEAERYMTECIAHIPVEPAVLREVRRAVAAVLPDGAPRLEAVAHRLGTSPRTLQRRLEDSGTSFDEVVDDIRKSLALRHVRAGALSLSEVAFLTGFADPSSFHRAFRRWTGTTPSEWRARQT
ncbi:MAG: AraC family transcriptional regulator [Actinobacteria bacterium]|nr:AraC family transcriptional regulator [Actinomycetota bacterium]